MDVAAAQPAAANNAANAADPNAAPAAGAVATGVNKEIFQCRYARCLLIALGDRKFHSCA